MSAEAPQHLCADARYTGELARRAMESHGCRPHVHSRHQEVQARLNRVKLELQSVVKKSPYRLPRGTTAFETRLARLKDRIGVLAILPMSVWNGR